jgi:hypothetical protein
MEPGNLPRNMKVIEQTLQESVRRLDQMIARKSATTAKNHIPLSATGHQVLQLLRQVQELTNQLAEKTQQCEGWENANARCEENRTTEQQTFHEEARRFGAEITRLQGLLTDVEGNARPEGGGGGIYSTNLQNENENLRRQLAESNQNLEQARRAVKEIHIASDDEAVEIYKQFYDRILNIVRRFYFIEPAGLDEIPADAHPLHREYFEVCRVGGSADWLKWRTMSMIFKLLNGAILSRPDTGMDGQGQQNKVEAVQAAAEKFLQATDKGKLPRPH